MKLYSIDDYIIAAKNMIKYGSNFEKHLGKALLVANEIERKKVSASFTKQFVQYLNYDEIMRTKSLREEYEDYLNKAFTLDQVIDLTERYHKLARLNSGQRQLIDKYTARKLYGTILKKFDKQKFNAGVKSFNKK